MKGANTNDKIEKTQLFLLIIIIIFLFIGHMKAYYNDWSN